VLRKKTAGPNSVVKTTAKFKTKKNMALKEEQAKEYLKTHRIMELLDNLTAQLIYERPGE